ncbi:cupin domain-containing protein [Paracoccus yeei]|uniref:cupin domain-containing protein n=1 Tax=Paracoccus yeei TaxID=147645 RepID=UPI003BF90738
MSVTIEKHYFTGNGRVPNSRLPLLIYRQVLRGPEKVIEDALRLNRWVPSWYSGEGMWPHHHFHSEAHEIIMVTAGTHKGKFGGHDGREATLHAGDVIVIPAGVGHMGRGISDDLKVTGGFPLSNGIVDFRYGLPDEYDDCARRAAPKCRSNPSTRSSGWAVRWRRSGPMPTGASDGPNPSNTTPLS